MTAEVIGLKEGDAIMLAIIQLYLPQPVIIGLLTLIGWRWGITQLQIQLITLPTNNALELELISTVIYKYMLRKR